MRTAFADGVSRVPDGGAEKLRVLLVEDEPDTAQSTAVLLRMWGHEVHLAADGQAALDAVEADCPDVVLLDMGLPGQLDGWQVAERLKTCAALKQPLVVAVTGHGDDGARARSEAVGVDLHLTKPVAPDMLLGLLERFHGVIRK